MLQDSAAVAGTIQIGEAAKLTALSIDAIRLYERRALLPKVPRTPGRFRLYTADDLSRLTFIIRINGVDAEPNEHLSFGLACRLYSSASHVPSQATLKRAIASARQAEER